MSRVDGLCFRSKPEAHTKQVQPNTYPFVEKKEGKGMREWEKIKDKMDMVITNIKHYTSKSCIRTIQSMVGLEYNNLNKI